VLRLPNRLSELATLRAAVDAVLRGPGVDEHVLFEVNVALEEIFCNVVEHAYPDGGEHVVDVRLELQRGVFRAVVSDDGVAFDPLAAPEPDVNAPLEERRIGGLGVFLTRKFMDEVSYRREAGRNVLTLSRAVGG
jgi:anti-sigma regulatory factor (Ser/Thr protein kinase)